MLIRNSTSTATTESQLSAGIAILRVVVGIIFIAHGAQKLFEVGPAAVAEGFGQAGIPMAALLAPAVSLIEFVGGIMLVLGLFTRPISVVLAGTMLGALLFVHLPAGFFLPAGYEFVLALMAATVALTLTGPGRLSIDHALTERRT